jgi:CheY-like chemotaxis protein
MHGHQILLVDDDESIRDSLSSLLEGEGYGVASVANGREALERLRSKAPPPCLILLDWMMPVMDGEAFLREQQQDSALAGIPVVVITAAAGTRLAALGGTPCIRKPIQIDKLMGAVQQHC